MENRPVTIRGTRPGWSGKPHRPHPLTISKKLPSSPKVRTITQRISIGRRRWSMSETKPALEMQFDEPAQQREAATLGMWVFLATEVLFFGVLFMSYTAYRFLYPQTFAAASSELILWAGSVNTAILLTSSLTMAFAVHAIQHNRRKHTFIYLLVTCLLAASFLGIKGYEYHKEYVEQHVPWLNFHFAKGNPAEAKIFFYLYFFMTGLHAIHV